MKPQEISEELMRDFANGRYRRIDDNMELIEFTLGTLRVRCKGYLDNVRAVADKYRKGFRHPSPVPPITRATNYHKIRPVMFREFIEAGEVENALAYVALYNDLSPLSEDDRRLITKLRMEHER